LGTSEPRALSSRTTRTLTAIARTLYPHDALPDAVYQRIGDRLSDVAAEDALTAQMIVDGVSALNAGGEFADLPADVQLKTLKELEPSQFFELLRSTAVVEVYSDERTWALVGYEGPSFDKGGYINRGFNDLDWLPEPDEAP
jgi:hypothetical protein